MPKSRYTFTCVVLLCLVGSPRAIAQPAISIPEEGHFPIGELSIAAGINVSPMSPGQESTGGIIGPDVRLHLDTRLLLINFEGIYNVADLGDAAWMTRAEIVLGSLLGIRDSANIIRFWNDVPRGSYLERTVTYYANRSMPLFFGLTMGVSVWRLRAATYSSGSLNFVRSPASLPILDVGLAVRSPQVEAHLAPSYEFHTHSKGLRLAFGYGVYIFDNMLFFGVAFDQLFGASHAGDSGIRMSTAGLFTVGIGTSIGARS